MKVYPSLEGGRREKEGEEGGKREGRKRRGKREEGEEGGRSGRGEWLPGRLVTLHSEVSTSETRLLPDSQVTCT